jgi:hypothetical protein
MREWRHDRETSNSFIETCFRKHKCAVFSKQSWSD